MGDIMLISNIDMKNILLDETLALHNIKRLQIPATRITQTIKSFIVLICKNMRIKKLITEGIESGLSDHTAQSCKVNFTVNQTNSLRMGSCLK